MTASHVLGIDLGTTNSVIAYARLDAEDPRPEVLAVPQLIAPHTIEAGPSLPSFVYLGEEQESGQGALDVPWQAERNYAVGEYARRQSAQAPDRTVSAAKSWLCHRRMDRHERILPFNAPDEVARISPVQATCLYLEHLVAAWEAAFPEAPVAEQQVVLTVPASFDANACELTREAAIAAGLPDDLVLLEEPQAALYAWLSDRGDLWRRQLKVGETILVCDVGGGTTDFTLVAVREGNGQLSLERVAVGNHLLIGGDNIDLTMAHHVATRFAEQNVELDPWQSVSLWHSCRAAKETLLAPAGPDRHGISVLGRGSRLIGKTVSVEVQRDEIRELILDGFFPRTQATDRPVRDRASGFQEMGLPFESDVGIPRHLSAFLQAHAGGSDKLVRPDFVLLNGGVFKAPSLSSRLLEVLGGWFGTDTAPRLLTGEPDLDRAVARGAAAYGWAKQRGGVRIRGGTARSYYVGIESAGLAVPGAPRPLHALCVVPIGMEEGTEADVPSQEIGLVVGEPAHFRFFSSPCRKQDRPGDLLKTWNEDELAETDSLETTLEVEDDKEAYVPVRFYSRVTELGMLELWCAAVNRDQRWKLEFSVRPLGEGDC